MKNYLFVFVVLCWWGGGVAQTSDMLFDRGYKHYEKGDYPTAIKYFHKAIDMDNQAKTKDWIKYYNIGLNYQLIDSFELSNYYLDTCVMLNPYVVEAYLNAGNNYLLMGRTKDAVTVFNQAIEVDSESIAIHNRGYAYFLLADYQKAIQDFQANLEINPDHFSSLLNGCKASAMLKDMVLAEEYLDRARRLEPENDDLLEAEIWIEANKEPLNKEKLSKLFKELRELGKDGYYQDTIDKFGSLVE